MTVYATIDMMVDEDGVLIAEYTDFGYIWWGVTEADLELDGCFVDTLDSILDLFGFDITGFYDELLEDYLYDLVLTSGEVIDFYVESECSP